MIRFVMCLILLNTAILAELLYTCYIEGICEATMKIQPFKATKFTENEIQQQIRNDDRTTRLGY